uniref:Knl1 C-terminal RWD domain-containing protein n=1 Tax=Arundo donax TaxID=35708 RepID=A0A0A9F090_ARUDO
MRSAEEQLEMRNHCLTIHRQAGLWELKDIAKRGNKRDFILNYRNLLFQRIILNISHMSSIFVINSLKGTKIVQTFPNLDATVAFNFVFKSEESHRVNDLRSLQKKTMETSFILGNLIDILEEIKFAKAELLNLVSAAFVLESQTCQLGLRLCFMSCKSGKRIAFTIDMTDLSLAVYPSEPSELLIKVSKAQTTLAQASIDKIMVSVRNLQPGCTMILRLCRMVSQLIYPLPG